MAKGGKLTKLTSMLKKWNSFTKQSGRSNRNVITVTNHFSGELDDNCPISGQYHHTVYVGKSRRQYLISTEVIEHPLFRELVERSGEDGDNYVVVGCEVVMFDHLLWMLDNADLHQPESLDDLVDFYSF